MKGISYMEHLIRQITEATRALELATHEIHKRDSRIHDLEIENQRLRDQLAFRATQYDEVLEIENQRLRDELAFRATQYDELVVVNEALQTHAANLESRIKTNRERIRRMEEGEL